MGTLWSRASRRSKASRTTKGYDLISTNSEKNRSVRIQVKSRYRTKAEGFTINDFGCDVVVIVLLNGGDKHGKVAPRDPDYYVVPVDIVKALPRTSGWGKISFLKFPDLRSYLGRWDLIRSSLDADD